MDRSEVAEGHLSDGRRQIRFSNTHKFFEHASIRLRVTRRTDSAFLTGRGSDDMTTCRGCMDLDARRGPGLRWNDPKWR